MIGSPKAILVRHYTSFFLLLILGASCTDRDLPLGTTPNKPTFEIQDGPVTPAAFYVANFTGNSITVYAAGATGNATPTATIAGSNTGLNQPLGIALDGDGPVYGTNCGASRPSCAGHRAGATGNTTHTVPIAGISTSGSDSSLPR